MSQAKDGNTKTLRNRCRRYCATLNNWNEEEYKNIIELSQKKCLKYIIGKEIGEKCGTPHLQMYFEFKNQVDFSVLKKWNERIHWKKADGTCKHNYNYCSKDGDFVQKNMLTKQDEIKIKLKARYKDVVWKDWQQDILNIVGTEADDRTVHWIYDEEGNKGKSFLKKYISLNYDCLVCDGKKLDVLNQLKTICIDGNKDIKIILLDVPRHNRDFINYGLLEQLKDGHVYSGKYEGGEIYLDNIHVIVFSNDEPDYSKFSRDRWNVISI